MIDGTDTPTEAQRGETDSDADHAIEVTGVYETRGGVVLYDSEEPLAWVQADNAVVLNEMA